MIERLIDTGDGARIYVEETGSGPTVVLCDGLACDGFIWRYLRPWLATRYRVVHWHYRGHGNTLVPWDHKQIGVRAYARDLRLVCDTLKITDADFFGHSMGVQVLLEFALADPGRVRSLTLICGSYGRPLDMLHGNDLANRAFPFIARLVARFPLGAQRAWSSAMGMDLVYAYAAAREVSGDRIRRADFQPYFDHLARMDVRLFTRILDDVREHTLEENLGDVYARTLVIAGERDTVTPVHLSERMARLMPNAELLVVPEGSHVAPIEDHALIEARLHRFLGH